MINFYKTNNQTKKYSTFIILIVLFLFLCSWASAQPIIDRADQAKFGQAQSYNNLRQSEQSLPIMMELFQEYPKNEDVLIEYIRALAQTEDTREVKIFLQEFVKDYDVKNYDPKTTTRVIEFLGLLRLYKQAIHLCHEFLARNPENNEIRLWLARVLSWNQNYQKSIEVYDELLTQEPDSLLLRREKARVQGWMRDYDSALETYQYAAEAFEDSSALGLEMMAKKEFYLFHDLKAAEYYKEWLKQEPDHLEAMFDLAQIYSRQKRWSKAEELYKKVLELVAEHPQANTAYQKLKILRDKNNINTGFTFLETDSSSRLADKRQYSLYEEMSFPLDKHAHLHVRHTDHVYNFSSPLSAVQSHTGEIGLDFYPTEKIEGSAGYIYSDYTDHVKDSHNTFLNVGFKPADIVQMNVSYQRKDVIENGESLVNGIRKDDVRLRLEIDPTRNLEFGADYGYVHYSDSNAQDIIGADIAYHILLAPKQLTLHYRYENYGFDKTSSNYFSPGSFHFNEVGIEWQQFLNKDELFWGSRNTYYTAGYAVNFDVGDQTGHKIYADIHKDWTEIFTTEIGWSKKIYEHQKTYSENTLIISGILYF